jgi:hypothetical protein
LLFSFHAHPNCKVGAKNYLTDWKDDKMSMSPGSFIAGPDIKGFPYPDLWLNAAERLARCRELAKAEMFDPSLMRPEKMMQRSNVARRTAIMELRRITPA